MANENLQDQTNRETNRRNTVLNRTFVTKLSSVLSLSLITAITVPVLAFAATGSFTTTPAPSYSGFTVNGSVYSTTYDTTGVGAQVKVFDQYGNYLNTATTATYTYDAAEGVYRYPFSYTTNSRFNYVKLQEVTSSVYQTVYNTNLGGGGSSGGGGGGGGVSTGGIYVNSDGSIDANALSNGLAAGDVTLKLSGTTALLPASALVGNGARTITVTNDSGTYVLPVSVFNLDALAKALGIEVKDLRIKITIAKVTTAVADEVKAAATAAGGTQLADAVDFNVVGIDKDSKTTPVDFGKTFVSRSVNVSKAVDSSKTTGVLYDESTKKLSFVPATFSTTDAKNTATLKRNGNSIYTVIETNKSFGDVASHWSKADVELLANKLVVEGSSDTTFEPERNITRAEFAALAVRSLGLTPVSASTYFTDVKSDAWYASVVATAAAAGLIDGYQDNTFRPDAQINREELAAIAIRAMNYASISTNVADTESVLSKFKDANKIVWAQKEIAAAVNAGLIDGMTADTLGSTGNATRAQSATVLKRFLSTAQFIN
ncbi:S-layer homology domain-containing protein [Paenibacillus agricola]|uniref:S-layer homology domain-containing protein n=1 Tax=Paenibacillus agricola TaxID=2716264 RepID=A0ABX0JIJ4_9BACL|nr:S-layer homology domain-containing protein [Paenibacillus agricola]NHN34269.1 S-layer homology domain-containing protein [Paenibacillus agricola]